MGVLLALGSSLAWGVSDFLAGLGSRRAGALAVTLLSQLVGALLAAVWVAASGEPLPGVGSLVLAAVAGLGIVLALAAYFHALAIGTMSIVAPICALGVAIPVVAGLLGGDQPTPLQLAGMPLAVGGVVLASLERGRVRPAAGARRSVLFALAAAVASGLAMWLLAPASQESLPWAVLVARGGAAPAFVIAAVAVQLPLAAALRRPARETILATGALGVLALALYSAATRDGALSVVAVLASLYPAVIMLLARGLLGERLDALQKVGVAGVLAGVVCLASP